MTTLSGQIRALAQTTRLSAILAKCCNIAKVRVRQKSSSRGNWGKSPFVGYKRLVSTKTFLACQHLYLFSRRIPRPFASCVPCWPISGQFDIIRFHWSRRTFDHR